MVRLRESMGLKTVCLASGELLDEDRVVLQTSLDRDQTLLQAAVRELQDQIDRLRRHESKKGTLRQVLQSAVHSVGSMEDAVELTEVDRQLRVLLETIQGLTRLVG